MAVPARSVKLVRIINKVSILGVILLILSSVSAIILFLLFSNELKKVDNSVTSLKNEISSLEKSEQKLYLVKDKLGKIAYVKSLSSAEDDLIQFKDLNESLSFASDSGFTQVDIGSKKTEVSLLSSNSDALSEVLNTLANLTNYRKIILSSLGFNPSSGFISSFIFESK